MLLKIEIYPAPILSETGAPVRDFDDDLARLAENMFETMYAARGVGLAAPQVGISLRFFVMDCDGTRLIAANPSILSTGDQQEGEEGCLSIASICAPLRRPRHVRLQAQDASGELFEIEASDLVARCLLHETDHCNGVLFIERLSPLRRDLVKRKLRKVLRKEGIQS
jgi:peptide deformylase